MNQTTEAQPFHSNWLQVSDLLRGLGLCPHGAFLLLFVFTLQHFPLGLSSCCQSQSGRWHVRHSSWKAAACPSAPSSDSLHSCLNQWALSAAHGGHGLKPTPFQISIQIGWDASNLKTRFSRRQMHWWGELQVWQEVWQRRCRSRRSPIKLQTQLERQINWMCNQLPI